MIGAMHANTLRVYAVLPPRDDSNDAGFNAAFAAEIRDVSGASGSIGVRVRVRDAQAPVLLAAPVHLR